MFCTRCGAYVPDGHAFCTTCGNQVDAAPAAQPVEMTEPVYYEQQETVVLSDYEYQRAPETEKKSFVNPFAGNRALLVKALAICCVLLLLLSYVAAVNTSFDKIPIVSMVFTLADEDGEIEEMKEELGAYAERLEKGYEKSEDLLKDELSKGELKQLKKFIDITNDCARKMSLHNFTKLLSCFEDLADFEMEDVGRFLVDSVDEAKEMKLLLNVIKGFLLFCALVCAVFVFFGGFKAKPGLAIFGTVLSVMYCLSYCHFLLLLLNLAAQIYMIRLAKRVKKENEEQMQYYPA